MRRLNQVYKIKLRLNPSASSEQVFEFYDVSFPIAKFDRYYNSNDMPMGHDKPTKKWFRDVDIDESYTKSSKTDHPVYFATLIMPDTGEELNFLIDGNHRAFQAWKNNRKINYVIFDVATTLKFIEGSNKIIKMLKLAAKKFGAI